MAFSSAFGAEVVKPAHSVSPVIVPRLVVVARRLAEGGEKTIQAVSRLMICGNGQIAGRNFASKRCYYLAEGRFAIPFRAGASCL
jgi:hypothetical protein